MQSLFDYLLSGACLWPFPGMICAQNGVPCRQRVSMTHEAQQVLPGGATAHLTKKNDLLLDGEPRCLAVNWCYMLYWVCFER